MSLLVMTWFYFPGDFFSWRRRRFKAIRSIMEDVVNQDAEHAPPILYDELK